MKFHDDEYTGVVLKIPCIIRKDDDRVVNGLQKIRTIIEEEIQPASCVSTMHPDWDKTYNELDYVESKRDIVIEKEAEQQRLIDEQQEKLHRFSIGKRITTTTKKLTARIQFEDHIFINEDILIDQEDITTDGMSKVKKSFFDEIWNEYGESMCDIIKNNAIHMYLVEDLKRDMIYIPHEFLYVDKHFNIGARFTLTLAEVCVQINKNGDPSYLYFPICEDEGGDYIHIWSHVNDLKEKFSFTQFEDHTNHGRLYLNDFKYSHGTWEYIE